MARGRLGVAVGMVLAAALLLSVAACKRAAGDSGPVATQGSSNSPSVEVHRRATDAGSSRELQSNGVAASVATPQASHVLTLSPTPKPAAPAGSLAWPCLSLGMGPVADPPGDGNLQWPPEVFVQWSPGGAEVLYNEGTALYGVTTDGSRVRHVARTLHPVHEAEWVLSFDISLEGRKVAYSNCEYVGWGSEYGIATTGLDGTQVKQLRLSEETEDGYDGYLDSYPAWSPDGRRIAFLRSHRRRLQRILGENAMLVTMAADGSDERTIVSSLDWLAIWPPEWSPDGRHIAFVGLRDGDSGWAIHTVGADGGGLQWLTDTLSAPAWSPDGSKILFIDDLLLELGGRHWWGDPEGGPGGVYVVGADGSGLVRVLDMCLVTNTLGRRYTLEVLSYTSAAWSPDGSRIAVSIDFNLKRARDGSEVHILLLTMDPDGSDRRFLAHGSHWSMIALGPEPTRVYGDPAGMYGGERGGARGNGSEFSRRL